MNPGCRHISQNLGLFGFGSPESALLQTTKELVENGIDACKELLTDDQNEDNALNKKKCIKVTLKSVDQNDITHGQENLILEVLDEGKGMLLNPPDCLSCFHTSKQNTQDEGDSNLYSTGTQLSASRA